MIPSLLVSAALAQTSGGELPTMNAQFYRPPVDSVKTLWTDDTSYLDDWEIGGRAFFHYVNEPLTYTRGDTETVLVANALQADLIGSVTYSRIRLGLDLPIYILANGDAIEGNSPGLGDIALDLKGTILNREDFPVGLALGARTGLPTATVDMPLGDDGIAQELQAIVDREFGDLLVAANLGTRFLPEVQLENVTLNDAFVFRLGGGYALSDDSGVSLDIAGQPNYATDGATSAPVEGLVGGWRRTADVFMLRGGLGTGLTTGIGSPQLRAVVALSYEPPEDRDRDMDGLIDKVDVCVDEPEDKDGFADEDGCPDPSTQVTVRVVDALDGSLISGAKVTATGDEPGEQSGGNELGVSMHAASLSVTASADGYDEASQDFAVPESSSYEAVVELQPHGGTITVQVEDEDGAAIEDFSWVLDKTTQDGDSGFARVGDHRVTARAEGYKPARQEVTIANGDEKVLKFVLESSQVTVTAERIEIEGKVYFDTAQATIKSESHKLLDDVAATLVAHHEITLVKIEGHTDSRGDDAYNLQLSSDRAAAVRQYLIDKGVESERLESEGFGEGRPLDDAENHAAWEKNRRVDFFVKERSDE